MAWARVDDGWWCHPKVLRLDLAARGLWISVLSWSCQHQTDHVPAAIVAMCGADERIAASLVTAGLWEGPDADGSYRIHDWDDYQSERAKKADAGRQGGLRSAEMRRQKQQNEAQPSASREAQPSASREAAEAPTPEAGPTRPYPTQPKSTPPSPPSGGKPAKPAPSSDATARKRAGPLPDGWQPGDRHRQIADQHALDVRREAEKMRNWAASEGKTSRDWDARFRNWLLKAAESPRQPRASPDPRAAPRDWERASRTDPAEWIQP